MGQFARRTMPLSLGIALMGALSSVNAADLRRANAPASSVSVVHRQNIAVHNEVRKFMTRRERAIYHAAARSLLLNTYRKSKLSQSEFADQIAKNLGYTNAVALRSAVAKSGPPPSTAPADDRTLEQRIFGRELTSRERDILDMTLEALRATPQSVREGRYDEMGKVVSGIAARALGWPTEQDLIAAIEQRQRDEALARENERRAASAPPIVRNEDTSARAGREIGPREIFDRPQVERGTIGIEREAKWMGEVIDRIRERYGD